MLKPLFNQSFNYKLYVRLLRTAANKEFEQKLTEETCNTRLLRVAIIGLPNAGKSTFINSLMDRKVCATSSKVHTTKKKSFAIFTEEDAQIVFVDTPGVISVQDYKKYNLQKSFLKDGVGSLHEADLIGVIHDASQVGTREILDMKIIKMLKANQKKSSFLVLNKVDLLKSKRKLLDIARLLTENRLAGQSFGQIGHKDEEKKEEIKDVELKTREKIFGWPYFNEIFMVSSLTGDGMDKLRDYLIDSAKPAPWLFPADTFSNEKIEDIIVNSVRAKLLDFLPQEIPYVLNSNIEFCEITNSGDIKTVVLVSCPNQRIAKLVAGDSNGKLIQITASVKHDLENTFRRFVRIKIVLET